MEIQKSLGGCQSRGKGMVYLVKRTDLCIFSRIHRRKQGTQANRLAIRTTMLYKERRKPHVSPKPSIEAQHTCAGRYEGSFRTQSARMQNSLIC